MHGREDQAMDIAKEDGIVLDSKGDDESSGSEELIRGVPGEMPPGKQVGDMKSEGL